MPCEAQDDSNAVSTVTRTVHVDIEEACTEPRGFSRDNPEPGREGTSLGLHSGQSGGLRPENRPRSISAFLGAEDPVERAILVEELATHLASTRMIVAVLAA